MAVSLFSEQLSHRQIRQQDQRRIFGVVGEVGPPLSAILLSIQCGATNSNCASTLQIPKQPGTVVALFGAAVSVKQFQNRGSSMLRTADPRASIHDIRKLIMRSEILPNCIIPDAQSIEALVWAYKSDRYSPYARVRECTRNHYDQLCKRLIRDHGDVLVGDINAYTVMAWHQAWLGPDGSHVPMAHGMLMMLRTVVGFGSVMQGKEECRRLREVLSGLRFPMGKPRTQTLTTKQVLDHCAKAHEAGYHSMALANKIQFSCTFRQKDVIGEWNSLEEKGPSILTVGARKWMRGIHWGEVDKNLILRHTTSKRNKPVEIDLKLAPMVLQEFALLDDAQVLKGGPIIVREETGLPYTAMQFRRLWRDIARAVGIPDDTKNMDSRAGAITEALSLGARKQAVRKSATHSTEQMTDRYARGDADDIAEVMAVRAKHHEEMSRAP